MALRAYNKQYKQRCYKCGKYNHKPGNCKCPENRKESDNEVITEKNYYKNKRFDQVCYHSIRKGHNN